MQIDLSNRVILVTGAYSGIGFACAKACIDAGAEVAIHARRAEELPRALEQLGQRASGVTGDLSDGGTPQALIAEVLHRHGRIDGLVNNAAMLTRSTIETVTHDLLQAMLAVNVVGPLLLIKAALPYLERAVNGGTIVNIGSINAWCGAPNLLAYSASKGALMTATRNLGDALGGRNVRINQINAGWTATETEHKLQLAEGHGEDWQAHLPKEFAPHGRLLEPREVAAHVTFWLSPASAPVTGQVYELEQYPILGRNRIAIR
jgi:NAD(P)-dependent dehydrogenase (short-subunit alcohol dehydrogenase family)